MKNETTSKKVAAIAGRVLAQLDLTGNYPSAGKVFVENCNGDLFLVGQPSRYVTAGDLRSLAASALTQTKDKPKKAK